MPRFGMFVLAVLAFGGDEPRRSFAAEKAQFNRDVRPILSDACFACHGPDKNKRKAKLRLDDRENAVARGAIVPGKPGESELVTRLNLPATDKQHMPPAEAHKTLTKAQIDTLTRWIAEGAEYQPHWAYIPPTRPKVPSTQYPVRNPIDAFVLAELAKRKMTLSPEADRRTLIRRVTLDLTGLPPTPAEVKAFVADKTPDAYETLVDRLLASPHFGERMATPWLDLVRFADTVGYHGDQNQRIFPYRDWVIAAFNDNMPFDQFTRDQLAGDLLPKPTPPQLVATGFNRLNMMTREGGAQPKEYLAKYQADRVRTVGVTWLGSTMGCAECHDHKYDPITAKDFYSMAAFFADIKQWGVYSDYGYTPNPELKGWTNDHPFPPEIEVESKYLKDRIEELSGAIVDLAQSPYNIVRGDDITFDGNDKLTKLRSEWWQAVKPTITLPPPGTASDGWIAPLAVVSGEGTVEKDGRVLFTGAVKKGETHPIDLTTNPGWVASVKVELLPHPNHKNAITRDGKPAVVQFAVSIKGKDGNERKLDPPHVAADRVQTRFVNTESVPQLAGGWRTPATNLNKSHTAVLWLNRPVKLGDGERLVVSVTSENVGCVRVSTSPLALVTPDEKPNDALFINGGTTSTANAQSVAESVAYLLGTAHDPVRYEQVKAIRKQILALGNGKAWTQVTVATTPITTRVLPRGNWMDETGAVVEPAVPRFLPQPKAKPGQRLTRLDLANWITSKDNPLTARVFVNRLWKQFFGVGLSAVMDDVGGQGEPPSHPELLDFLAVEFAEKWDIKHMVKLIVTSATYKQSSRTRPELKDADPNNRLLAFLSPRRLEAEFVRDSALAAAGLLSTDIGGPSVKPYQPDGYYANIQFPDRKYVADRDDRQYRRGLYMHWQRTFLHPMLANFDAPSREECTATRATANTPQQALTLLNDPTFVEAARVLGAKALAAANDDAARLDWLVNRVLARSPLAGERDALLGFLAAQRKTYAADPAAAAKLLAVGVAPAPAGDQIDAAAWATVARVVLNLHEAITRY